MLEPIVTIENGSLKGRLTKDYQGKPYYSFQGIPYAKPPIGDLRFKDPQPPESWTGIRNATEVGNGCFSKHILFKTNVGSEDCLFLNVYTPKLRVNNEELKPVIFWIHGGGFVAGSGDTKMYGPSYLVSENIVLVTINYRLGLFGFLAFDDLSLKIPGNAGMKDQVMALKWVRKNIAHFGGDPNNVTVSGVSSGSACAHYLILSPLTKGLFHKGILQSGTALSAWARGQKTTSALAELLNMVSTDETHIFEVLRSMSSDEILELQEKMTEDFDVSFLRTLGPVIEDQQSEKPFLTQEPLDIIKSGNYNHVPIIIGYTSREGLLHEVENKRKYGKIKFISNFEYAIPWNFKVTIASKLAKSISEKIKYFYYGSEKPSFENIDQYYLLQGDNSFVHSTHSTIKYHNLTSHQPIYLYKLSAESRLNFYKRFGKIKTRGASHADDIGYFFTTSITPRVHPNSVEYKHIQRCTKLWTAFVRTGNPNLVHEKGIIQVNWKPIEKNLYHYLNIGDEVTIGLNPDYERVKFWDEIEALSLLKCKF